MAAVAVALIIANIAEIVKKGKTFKMIAIRGADNLLLPLCGKQDDLEKFKGQVRYEIEDFEPLEKILFYLGSRIYAKIYESKDSFTKPEFSDDHKSSYAKLKITSKDAEIKIGNASTEELHHYFNDILGITTNNFLKSGSDESVYEINGEGSGVNKWSTSSDLLDTLDGQLNNL